MRTLRATCVLGLVVAIGASGGRVAVANDPPDVTITGPAVWTEMRGPEAITVTVHCVPGGSPLERVVLYANDVQKDQHVWVEPRPVQAVDWEGKLYPFGIDNGQLDCKAKLWDTRPVMDQDLRWFWVDNAYLLSVTRGDGGSPGTITWKYWSGDGWTAIEHDWLGYDVEGWQCSTEGGADGYCTGACGHGIPHNYCVNGDTPPYLKSDAQNDRSYPEIAGLGSSSCGDMGIAAIVLPSTTAPCGCARGVDSRIWIHGRREDGQCPANSSLLPTLGCIRTRNGYALEILPVCQGALGRGADVRISVPGGQQP